MATGVAGRRTGGQPVVATVAGHVATSVGAAGHADRAGHRRRAERGVRGRSRRAVAAGWPGGGAGSGRGAIGTVGESRRADVAHPRGRGRDHLLVRPLRERPVVYPREEERGPIRAGSVLSGGGSRRRYGAGKFPVISRPARPWRQAGRGPRCAGERAYPRVIADAVDRGALRGGRGEPGDSRGRGPRARVAARRVGGARGLPIWPDAAG